MNRTARLLAATTAGLALAGGTALAGAPSASAASISSWTRTAATKANAYSWNGYKATVAPAGFAMPKGYVKVSATETVKKGSATVATNRTSANLAAGTYTVYSTFKYRARTPYITYTTHTLPSSMADSCTVESAQITTAVQPGNFQTVTYTGSCTWTEYDADYNEHTSTGTASWTEQEYVPFSSTGPVAPVHAPGYTDTYVSASGNVTWRTASTAYRYGATKTALRVRTVTVTKVVNTPTMTATEWNTIMALPYWPTHAQVARIAGSSGHQWYAGSLGTSYHWNGSAVTLWFDADGTLSDSGNSWIS